MKPIRITLYKMENCTHCVKFEPEWDKMKTISNPNIELIEYERSELDNLDHKNKTINGTEIDGFPTIKVSINAWGNNLEYEYSGNERTAKNIYSSALNKLKVMNEMNVKAVKAVKAVKSVKAIKNVQAGGSRSIDKSFDKIDKLLALNLSDICTLDI